MYCNTQYPFILIIILTALTSCAGLFQSPAFHASLVDIVGKDKVQQATGVLNVADNVSRISGLAIGGVVVAAFGGSIAISVDAVTFMLSAILVLLSGKFPNSTKKQESKIHFKRTLLQDSSIYGRTLLLNLLLYSRLL